jgi:hypothetical protein
MNFYDAHYNRIMPPRRAMVILYGEARIAASGGLMYSASGSAARTGKRREDLNAGSLRLRRSGRTENEFL